MRRSLSRMTDEKQNVDIKGQIDGLKANDIVIGKAAVALAAQDIFKVPSANGSVTASDVSASGIDITGLDAQATQDGKTTNFKMNAGLKNGARTSVGRLAAADRQGLSPVSRQCGSDAWGTERQTRPARHNQRCGQ